MLENTHDWATIILLNNSEIISDGRRRRLRQFWNNFISDVSTRHNGLYILQGDTKQLGSLLLQAPFSVWLQNGYNRMRFKLSPSCRHLFLYEQAIMFCKLKQQLNSTVAYVFKTLIKVIFHSFIHLT